MSTELGTNWDALAAKYPTPEQLGSFPARLGHIFSTSAEFWTIPAELGHDRPASAKARPIPATAQTRSIWSEWGPYLRRLGPGMGSMWAAANLAGVGRHRPKVDSGRNRAASARSGSLPAMLGRLVSKVDRASVEIESNLVRIRRSWPEGRCRLGHFLCSKRRGWGQVDVAPDVAWLKAQVPQRHTVPTNILRDKLDRRSSPHAHLQPHHRSARRVDAMTSASSVVQGGAIAPIQGVGPLGGQVTKEATT